MYHHVNRDRETDQPRLPPFLICLAITLIAIGLRLWQIEESLWLDELHTAWVVESSWAEIPQRARIGNQSPLYFALPAATTAWLGNDEWVIRLPSLLAGIALVPSIFVLVRKWTHSVAAAATAAALTALDANCIFYAQEARPYAWVQLVGLWHLAIFVDLQERPSRGARICWIASGIGLFWLHYLAALLFAAEFVWYVWLSLRTGTAYQAGLVACDVLAMAVGVLPATGHLLEIGERRSQWDLFIDRLAITAIIQWFSLVPYVLVPLGLATVGRLVQRERLVPAFSGAAGSAPSLLVAWFAVPVGLAWILTWTDLARIFFPRYLAVCFLAPLIASGLTIAMLPSSRRRGVVAVAVVVISLWLTGLGKTLLVEQRPPTTRRQGWRGAIAWLNRQSLPEGTPIFVRSGLIEADQLGNNTSTLFREYCLLPLLGPYRVPVSHPLTPLPTARPIKFEPGTWSEIAIQESLAMVINGSEQSRTRVVQEVLSAAARAGVPLQLQRRQQFGTVLVVVASTRK